MELLWANTVPVYPSTSSYFIALNNTNNTYCRERECVCVCACVCVWKYCGNATKQKKMGLLSLKVLFFFLVRRLNFAFSSIIIILGVINESFWVRNMCWLLLYSLGRNIQTASIPKSSHPQPKNILFLLDWWPVDRLIIFVLILSSVLTLTHTLSEIQTHTVEPCAAHIKETMSGLWCE